MSIYDLQYGRTDTPGGGLAPTPQRFDIFRRLLAPEEFDELGPGQKTLFDGYMDYVNQYHKEQKRASKYGTPGTQRVPQGGSRSVAGVGMPISTASNRQATTAKGGSAIPRYRTKTDITGKVTYEPIGGKRTMEGEYIPTSLEELKSAEELKYAIPKIQTESELDFVLKEAALAQAKAAKKSPKALMEQERVQQRNVALEQTAKRTQIAQDREARLGQQFFRAQNFREANALAEREFKKEMLNLKAGIDKERDKFSADERKELADINNQASLNRAMTTLDKRIAAMEEGKEKDRLNDIRKTAEAAEYALWLKRASMSESEFKRSQANWQSALDVAKTGQARAQPAQPTDQFQTPEALIEAVKSGAITAEQAKRIASEKGWK